MHVELSQRLAEVESAREAETVHRAGSVLAQINFVHVSEHDFALVVPEFEHERHQRLADLARVRLAVGKEVATYELHGQRASALARCRPPARWRAQHEASRAYRCRDVCRSAGLRPPSVTRSAASELAQASGSSRSSPCVGKMLPIKRGSNCATATAVPASSSSALMRSSRNWICRICEETLSPS